MASTGAFRGRGKSNGESRKDDRAWNNAKPSNTGNKQVVVAQPNAECVMDELLKKHDLFRKPVAKDGSCLFRVVAEQVYSTQSRHLDVRSECIQYMKQNRKLFESFIEGSFDHYLYQLRNPREWGGQVEISALSLLYNRDFVVYQSSNQAPQAVTCNGFKKKIHLCYSNGNHYDAVYPLKYRATAAISQSILYELLMTSVFPEIVKRESDCPSELQNGVHGEGNHSTGWTEVKKQKGSKTTDDVDPIVAALPDAASNKETYWQIKRSLDASNYRNIALEVWNNTKADQHKQDRTFAAALQFQKGDMCFANINVSNNVKELHKVKIEDILEEKNLYVVSSPDMKDKLHLSLEDLKPLSNGEAHDSYKNLPGYYNKNDLDREGEFQSQRRRGRGGRRNRDEENRARKADSSSAVLNRANSGRRERGGYKNANLENSKNINRPMRREIEKKTKEENLLPDTSKNVPAKKVEPEKDVSPPTSVPKSLPLAEPTNVATPPSPNIGDSPSSKKVAESTESPAAFWGRMRNTTPTSTQPKSSSIAQKDTKVPSPSTPNKIDSNVSSTASKPTSATVQTSQTSSQNENTVDTFATTDVPENDPLQFEVIASNASNDIEANTPQDNGDITIASSTESNFDQSETKIKSDSLVNGLSGDPDIPSTFEPINEDASTSVDSSSFINNSEDTSDGRSTPSKLKKEHSSPSSPVSLSDEDSARASKARANILIATSAKLPTEAKTADASIANSSENVLDFGLSMKDTNRIDDFKAEMSASDDNNDFVEIIEELDDVHMDSVAPEIPLESSSVGFISSEHEPSLTYDAITNGDEKSSFDSPAMHAINETEALDTKNTPLCEIDDPSIIQQTTLLPDPVILNAPSDITNHISLENLDTAESLQGQIPDSNDFVIPNIDDQTKKDLRDKGKKKVSFGSATEIIESQETQQVMTVNSNGVVLPVPPVSPSVVQQQPEPGKIILPPELIEKHQSELIPVHTAPEYQLAPHLIQQQQQTAAFIHAGMPLYHAPPMMMPMFYPPTAVNEQYHIPNGISRDPEGKDLPEDIPTLRHFFNLGVNFHHIFHQQQQQQQPGILPIPMQQQIPIQQFRPVVLQPTDQTQRGDKYVGTQMHPNHMGGVMEMHMANSVPEEQPSQINVNAHPFHPNTVVSMQNAPLEEYEMPPRIRRTQGNNRFNNSRYQQQMPMNYHQRSFNNGGRGIMGQGPGILRADGRNGNNRFHYQQNMPFASNSFGH